MRLEPIEFGHEFVEANGLRFHVATCGEGERLALCLHGFPECWYSWRYQLSHLARLGYRAWAPDLRGYGETAGPPRSRDYAIEILLADVGALIDASRARTVLLLGHDWGGIIAWYFAMRRVRPLERLVIMNLPHPGAAAGAVGPWEMLRRFWYALFFQIPWLPEKLLGARECRAIGEMFRRSCANPNVFPEDVLSIYRRAAARPGNLKAMLDYYRALIRGGGLKRQRALGYPTIETPTLVVWGEDDVALPKASTTRTGEFVRNLTLRVLPGVSHWVQQDAPELVNVMLEAWLQDKAVPEAPLSARQPSPPRPS